MLINGIYTCNFVVVFTLLKSSDNMILMLYHIYQKYKNDYIRIISKEENTKKKKINVNYLQKQPRKIRKNTGMSTNYTKMVK